MNKAPQPIGGPPTTPHPAPSPGLTQPAYPPGQAAPVVFAPTQATQMNTPPQPRQGGFRSLQPFYQNRAQAPSSASRVQSSTSARPVAPTHVFQPGSQMMMIPQQIPYAASQGPYYIPNQFRSTYVTQTQQYTVPPGAPGFYPGTTPTDFSTYGTGAYYPAQGVQQFPPTVPAAPVLINQPQHITTKRERKQIRIRDPNQGGKDITEEIMSGGRTSSTPTPPQANAEGVVQANGENPHPVPVVIRPDDRPKPPAVVPKPVAETSRPASSPSPVALVENPTEVDTKPESLGKMVEPPSSALLNTISSSSNTPIATMSTDTVIPSEAPVTNTVTQEEVAAVAVAVEPVAEPLPVETQAETEEEPPVVEVEDQQEEIILPPTEAVAVSPPPREADHVEANGVSEEQPLPPTAEPELLLLTECQLEPVMDSPIAQPEELKLANGLGAGEKQPEVTTMPAALEEEEENLESDVSPISEPEVVTVEEPKVSLIPPSLPEEKEKEEEPVETPSQNAPLTTAATSQNSENAMQVLPVQSIPILRSFKNLEASCLTAPTVTMTKKRRRLKDLNKKEPGDVLDAFKEVKDAPLETESQAPTATPAESEDMSTAPQEEADETWEEKEDKLDTENIKPDSIKAAEQKYQYKEEQWKPLNPEEKKKYDREFLLGFQFIFASMQKPEGLPHISDVVLDKANKTPLRPLDPSRLTGMNCGPDFTPSFANLGRQPMGGRGPKRRGRKGRSQQLPSGMGPRRSQQGLRKEPRKIIATVSLSDDVQLNKADKAWKPSSKRSAEEDDAEMIKTQDLFRKVRSILNKLTPQMFQQLMKQVTELTIDTEERLKGVIDLVFEKAISEPNFSVAYANMCRCLMGLKVPTTDKPGVTVNFRKVLLNRCQKEFEKDKDDDEVFEKKQKEMDAAAAPEVKAHLKEELEDARDKARRRSLGNIKFIGELFKLKMLTEPIMHDCIVKLLKNHDEESLECLCRLLTTIGKDLDFEKAKPRMDQYFNQMEKIIKERKTSSRIRFMLQDVIDLRMCIWVPRRGDQGPKTIDQIHKDAEMEEHREQIKVAQQLLSKQEKRRGGPPGAPSGRSSQTADDGWNTVPISKGSRPIDTTRITKITKPGAIDYNNQLLAPGGRLGSWGKGSSGGSGAKPSESATESGRPSTLNRFSALQQPSSTESSESRRVVQRSSSSRDRGEKLDRDRGDRFERSDRYERGGDRIERNRPPITAKRSFSKEVDDRSRERERQSSQDPVRRVASMTEERDRTFEADKSKETVPAAPSPKPALSEEDTERKSKSIIEEYLHINDIKEALQCVQELNSPTLLFIFVRNGIESTLERSTIAREHMGLLLYQLVKAGTLPKEQYYKGLQEILEVAEDMAIDIPHIWPYLAELITPILHESGLPMGEVFREISKSLVPIGKAGILLVDILSLLCKEMSHKKAGTLWREAGLSWKEFLPEDQDVNKFVTEQKKVEFTLGDDSEMPSKKELSSDELSRQVEKMLKENADNQRIYDWIEQQASLDEQQVSSNTFIRALMTSICQSAIIFENPYRVDTKVIVNRSKVLQKYLTDDQKELQALYALQALVVKLDQPPNLLRMFFDALYDEDVIKEEAFYKWESSKDPAEQQGKGVALKSVTAFFTWLREAEEESDNS
uniref:Eukaryotic translation initiation factor 4 gamma 1 n=1 Tax=Latimeria chalumnae TaxID=7897 RepID=H3A733_LATCH